MLSKCIYGCICHHQFKSALEDLFSVRCNPLLSSGRNLLEFESSTDGIGSGVSDAEPFCGRYSLKNPYWIFHKGTEDDASGVPVATSSNRFVSTFHILKYL